MKTIFRKEKKIQVSHQLVLEESLKFYGFEKWHGCAYDKQQFKEKYKWILQKFWECLSGALAWPITATIT